MRRTIETSPLQSLRVTGETCVLYLAAEAVGNGIHIPRTSLAIFNAVSIAFPDELEGRKQEALQVISNFAPVLIAANEAADIGISARLQWNDLNRSHTEGERAGLKQLEETTFKSMERSTAGFKNTYGSCSRECEIVDALIRDFLTLSSGRRNFQVQEYREYVELDSVMNVLGCIALSAPRVLERCGFDMGESCETVEDVRRKYSAFIVGGAKPQGRKTVLMPGADETGALAMAQIMSLEGAEMVLKVDDDKNGRRVDKLLGIPNLYDYAEQIAEEGQSPHGIVNRMRNEYLFLAETGGLSRLLVWSAELLRHLTSAGKAKMAGLKLLSQKTEVISIADSTTTTLRHELDASGVLEKLFSGV